MKNIQNLIYYKKGYIDFCHQTPPSLENGHILPHFPQKRLYSFLSSDAPFSQKWLYPQKLFFIVVLKSIVCLFVWFFFFFFFWKNCLMKNIQNLISYKKGFTILIFPLLLKLVISIHKQIFAVFSKNLLNNKISGAYYVIGYIHFSSISESLYPQIIPKILGKISSKIFSQNWLLYMIIFLSINENFWLCSGS